MEYTELYYEISYPLTIEVWADQINKIKIREMKELIKNQENIIWHEVAKGIYLMNLEKKLNILENHIRKL
jgi:hypothetical protein